MVAISVPGVKGQTPLGFLHSSVSNALNDPHVLLAAVLKPTCDQLGIICAKCMLTVTLTLNRKYL